MRSIVLFFFLASTLANGQKHQLDQDSIRYYLNNSNSENKIKFAKRAIYLSMKIKNDSLLRESVIKWGLSSYSKRNVNELKSASDKLLELFNEKRDSFALAKNYHFKALLYRIQNRLDSSYFYYNKSKEVSILLGDSLQVGIRLKSMANMQNSEKDYLGAQSTIVEALEYLVPLKGETTFTRDSYNILGIILINIKQYEESRKYFKKAGETFSDNCPERTRDLWKVQLLNNIGYSYLEEKKYSKALEYFEEGLRFPNVQVKFNNTYKLLLENAAPCKYALGRKEEAWNDFNHLLDLREKEGDAFRLSRTHNNFAHYYMEEKKYDKALYHAKKSYELSKKRNHNMMTELSLRNLVLLTSGQESKDYFEEYIILRDSLYEREINIKEQFALVKYQTVETETENAGLKLKTTQQEARIEQDKLRMIILILVGIIVVVILITYYSNHRKKLMYEAQLQKAAAREEERQQIAKSLHDEVAGDLRIVHQKLSKTELKDEAKSVEKIKENVRNLSHQLSSVSFQEVSFKDQIINLVSDHFDPKFRISVEGIDTVLWQSVNPTIKRTLYLCTRECLQNTIKYADASKFFIIFSSEKKEIQLLLKDNGKGFEAKNGKKGIGLKNLKERVEEIHGSFHVETSEQGTKTTIRIPIHGR
jgi:signal transduction histidine kinase